MDSENENLCSNLALNYPRLVYQGVRALVAQQPSYNKGTLFWAGYRTRESRTQKKGKGYH